MSEGFLKRVKISGMTWDENVAYFQKMRPQIEQWNAENEKNSPVEVAFHRAVLNQDLKTALSIVVDWDMFLEKQKAQTWTDAATRRHFPMIRRMVEALPS